MLIENKTYEDERSLYGITETTVSKCIFKGEKDGESPLKEASNVKVDSCDFYLRYPLWHVKNSLVLNSVFYDTCRAPVWYGENIIFSACKINGVKFLRESDKIQISASEIFSNEFSWRVSDLTVKDTCVISEYPFFECKNINADGLRLQGKYSFQYVENGSINHSVMKTKDAFWHAKNVTVSNSVIDGEYIGWYSENLRFVNCKITGTQPFCCCKGLVLENCEMINADLAFEKSDVKANIVGSLISIKNPLSGEIVCDNAEIINEYSTDCKIKLR